MWNSSTNTSGCDATIGIPIGLRSDRVPNNLTDKLEVTMPAVGRLHLNRGSH